MTPLSTSQAIEQLTPRREPSMIIRLHVILVSHIASRRLIELDAQLAAGVEQPELANPGASRSATARKSNSAIHPVRSSGCRERFG